MAHHNRLLKVIVLVALVLLLQPIGPAHQAKAQTGTLDQLKNTLFKGLPIAEFLSAGGYAAVYGADDPGNNNPVPGYHDNGRGGNSYVNDPCLDPPPPGRRRTVQSETELAVLNTSSSMGKKIVAGY